MTRPPHDPNQSAADVPVVHSPAGETPRPSDDARLLSLFNRVRLAGYLAATGFGLAFAVFAAWGAGFALAAVGAILGTDAIRQQSADSTRTVVATLYIDAVAAALILAVGRFPIAVTVAVFSILIGAGALMLHWHETVKFFGVLGVLGFVASWLTSRAASPWTTAQESALSILAIGLVPLTIVLTLVAAGRERGVSRVLARRLDDTEAALRATEERFERAFGSAPSGLVITDLDGTIIQANKAFARMVGVDHHDDLEGTDLFAFFDPTDNEVSDADFDELASGVSSLHHRRIVTRDGRRIWGVMSVSLIDDGRDGSTQCVTHVMDVTDSQNSRLALEASNRRLEALHQITNAGLEAQDLSEAADRITEVIGDVFLFPGVSICVHDPTTSTMSTVAYRSPWPGPHDDVADETALCARAALSAEPFVLVERRGRISSVHNDIRSVLSVPLTIDEGSMGALTLTDIEERIIDRELVEQVSNVATHVAAFLRRVLAEEQLAQLIRSKDQFIASVSHEVRTPLTAVVGLAAELRDRFEDMEDGEQSEIMDIVAEQSTEVAHIVEDLLVTARSDLATLNLKLEDFSVAHQVDRVAREIERLGDREIAIDAPEELGVHADSGRFRQILRNLLTNAVRYGGTAISVEAARTVSGVTVRVCDNGVGLPEREWERIFEPYKRSHNAIGQPGSVGIGLTVSRKLARLMGGDLMYRFVGDRSMFELELPHAEANPARVDLSA